VADHRSVGDDAARADTLLADGTRVGDFRILRFLGQGAMGEVYLALDLTLGRLIALKFIKSSVLERHGVDRFLHEARTTASLNHPHIVTIHAVGEHDDRPYLALEYVDGESLRSRLAAGPMPLPEAVRCCSAVAEAVAEAHRQGLVHADLKPENVVIPRDGRVRVVDFGVAKLVGGASGAASGTPAYMAPERWRGAPPTGAIDVWALGVILHELIVGRRPIDDAALPQLSFSTGPLALPGLPETPWAELVRDCLAIDPVARPTAEELARRLGWLRAPPSMNELTTEEIRVARTARLDYDIERRRHEGFVGRAALLSRLDRLLIADRIDRWVVVTGGPGMGKSALLAAWLVRREAAGAAVPHHFIRRGEYDWDDPAKLVGSLVAQIEERFPAQREAAADADADTRHPAARLAAALARVSAKELVPRGERLVLLIDGLDEYDPRPGSSSSDQRCRSRPGARPPTMRGTRSRPLRAGRSAASERRHRAPRGRPARCGSPRPRPRRPARRPRPGTSPKRDWPSRARGLPRPPTRLDASGEPSPARPHRVQPTGRQPRCRACVRRVGR